MWIFLLSLFALPSTNAATWIAGTYSIELVQDVDGDWVTSNCRKTCSLDIEVRRYLEKSALSEEDLSGGKNPGSVLCKKIDGRVIYLEFKNLEEAFCQINSETVSLGRLARAL